MGNKKIEFILLEREIDRIDLVFAKQLFSNCTARFSNCTAARFSILHHVSVAHTSGTSHLQVCIRFGACNSSKQRAELNDSRQASCVDKPTDWRTAAALIWGLQTAAHRSAQLCKLKTDYTLQTLARRSAQLSLHRLHTADIGTQQLS